MQPRDLTAASFNSLPPEARALAVAHLELLRTLPLVFAPLLLREIAGYDWRLPAERAALERQISYLSATPGEERRMLLAGFGEITLPSDLAHENWVADPSGFTEKLTASLWSTHQIERFRGVAEAYQRALDAAVPTPRPRGPRLAMVALGAGVPTAPATMFRKLQPFGVYFTAVAGADGWPALLDCAARRASRDTVADGMNPKGSGGASFRHWHIDGGLPDASAGLVQVSYEGLQTARARLLLQVQKAMATGSAGPEQLRSLLARLQPEDVGLPSAGAAGVLNRFQLSLLTEGSGTQIFATTFVQWAARECIRRAEPDTVLLRFRPRRQAQSLNRMLAPGTDGASDPTGSLVDAEMGAYYTWLELRRLPGGDDLRFLVWFEGGTKSSVEGGSKALLIGPGLPRGTSSDSPITVPQLLKLLD